MVRDGKHDGTESFKVSFSYFGYSLQHNGFIYDAMLQVSK